MMNKDQDQAGLLRKLAEESNTAAPASGPLPPRREFHQRKRKEVISENNKPAESEQADESKPFPLLKIVLFAFLLLIAATFTYDYWSGRMLDPFNGNESDEPVQVQIEK
jgi:hypothetical protein